MKKIFALIIIITLVSLYPNPANEELKIKTDAVYKSYTITNSIG